MFWQLALTSCWWLTPTAKNACFAFQRQFLKPFLVFPKSFVTINCLLCLNLLKRHSVHTQTLLNLSLSSPIFKKRYGFCFLLNVFLISCPISLGLCCFCDLVLYLILEYRYSFSIDYNVYFCWFCGFSPCLASTLGLLCHTPTHCHT